MKYLIIIFSFALFSCNSVNEKPYVILSISEPNQYGYGYIEYVDSDNVKCYIYDDVNFYKKGDTINEN